jgi:hypothetical protein
VRYWVIPSPGLNLRWMMSSIVFCSKNIVSISVWYLCPHSSVCFLQMAAVNFDLPYLRRCKMSPDAWEVACTNNVAKRHYESIFFSCVRPQDLDVLCSRWQNPSWSRGCLQRNADGSANIGSEACVLGWHVWWWECIVVSHLWWWHHHWWRFSARPHRFI